MIEKKLRILWYMQYQVSRRLHIQPTACVATPHTLVYRNTRIIATNRPPPPHPTQGKQPCVAQGAAGQPIDTTGQFAKTTQPNAKAGFMMKVPKYNCAGIDIAKRNFVIAVSSLSKTKTETNNTKGIAHTVEYLKKHKVALVMMESTGGLEIPAAKAIHRSGIA